jgi:cell wall-associated NlpC family hydrolase
MTPRARPRRSPPGADRDEAGFVGVAVAAAGAFVLACAIALPLMFTVIASPANGAAITNSAPSALALSEIPPYLLPHYQSAPACTGLPWQIVAAIGYIESRHGQGRVNPTTGDTNPPILGPALDGSGGNMAIPATTASTAYTGDPRWDHAVGPMQFLTSTWQAWGVDGSGDGAANPNNAYDAIAGAGRYLCNGKPTLDSVSAAIRRYNNSATYEADVTAKAIAYGMNTAGSSPGGPGGTPFSPGTTVSGDMAKVINFALAQLGKPYVWGATGPNSYDCSGLTQASYAAAGIHIGRVTTQQATDGAPVDWHAGPLHPGDLIFMDHLGHVAVALDATHMIQAPYTGTVVQISPIPFSGIDLVRRIITS